MIAQTLQRFSFLMDTVPQKLLSIPAVEFDHKADTKTWSKKEIIGHLIDRAANNHQRLVRTQYETLPHIVYDPDQWNFLNGYQQMEGKTVIEFWTMYNKHLLELIKKIPSENLLLECNTGDENNHTLGWIINDYLDHMEHHLKQVIPYA